MSKSEGKKLIEVFNNCTQIHHMYDTIIRKDEKRIAFESDILSTGCTHSVSDIELVVVELADSREVAF